MIKIAIMSPFKDEGKKLLINNNFKVINEKKLSKTNYKSIEGVILDTRDFKNERLDKFKNLKIISRFGVGVNNVDLKVLKKKNSTEYYKKFYWMVSSRTCFHIDYDLLKKYYFT